MWPRCQDHHCDVTRPTRLPWTPTAHMVFKRSLVRKVDGSLVQVTAGCNEMFRRMSDRMNVPSNECSIECSIQCLTECLIERFIEVPSNVPSNVLSNVTPNVPLKVPSNVLECSTGAMRMQSSRASHSTTPSGIWHVDRRLFLTYISVILNLHLTYI